MLVRFISAEGGEVLRITECADIHTGLKLEIKSGNKNCQVLFISSTLLSEPVAWGGPIVMNTNEDLSKAFDDLNKGTFLQEKITY